MSSHIELRALPHDAELEMPLLALERQLGTLGVALSQQDVAALDHVAAELHVSLAAAVEHFSRAARSGGVPPGLRHRLALAGGRVAAQREALARATASLDRAIEVLMPDLAPAHLYSAAGSTARAGAQGGSLRA